MILILIILAILFLIFFIKKEKYQNINIMQRYNTIDPSGSVWINSSFDVKKEDPGLSWVL